jgi:hypothetical protein
MRGKPMNSSLRMGYVKSSSHRDDGGLRGRFMNASAECDWRRLYQSAGLKLKCGHPLGGAEGKRKNGGVVGARRFLFKCGFV